MVNPKSAAWFTKQVQDGIRDGASLADAKSNLATAERYAIRRKDVVAHLVHVGKKWVVLRGSTARSQDAMSWMNGRSLRDTMVKQGVLGETEDGKYVFTKNFAFRSISQAASVVLAKQANGNDQWKREADGAPVG